MILTAEVLQKLNITMVGLGEPIDKDFSGYNKVHYYQMVSLSRVPSTALTPIQMYAITGVLLNYTKTQLLSYANDLKETYTFLKNQLPSNLINQYEENKGQMFRHAYAEYKEAEQKTSKKPLHIISVLPEGVILHYDGYISDMKDFIAANKDTFTKWVKDSQNKWNVQIRWVLLLKAKTLFEKNNYATEELTKIQKKSELLIKQYEEEIQNSILKFDIFMTKNDYYLGKKFYITIKSEKAMPSSVSTEVSHLYSDNIVPYIKIQEKNIMLNVHLRFFATIHTRLMKILMQGGIKFEFTDIYNEYLEKSKLYSKASYPLLDVNRLKLRFKPFSFQLVDAQNLLMMKKALNLNEMGCGKTFEQVLVGESIPMPKLVICPASLLIMWKREIHNVNPKSRVTILKANEEFKVGDWTIVSYDTAVKFLNELNSYDFQVVMVDEAHLIRTVNAYGEPKSARGKAVRKLVLNAEYVYMITGTPIPSSHSDVYNLLNNIDSPELCNGNFYTFAMEYCAGYKDRYGFIYKGSSNQTQLGKILSRQMVRHKKKDVLPNLKKQRIFLPVDCDLKKYSQACEKIVAEAMKSGRENPFMTFYIQCQQMLSKMKVSYCADFALNLLEEGKKVVIVSNYIETLTSLRESRGLKSKCCMITGDMTVKQRTEVCDKFMDINNDTAQVCLLSLKAGGVGLTLTSSCTMIICDFAWLPSDMLQVEDRICRQGQIADICSIYYLYCADADVDEYFTYLLQSKAAVADLTVDRNAVESLDFVEKMKAMIMNKMQSIQGKDNSHK